MMFKFWKNKCTRKLFVHVDNLVTEHAGEVMMDVRPFIKKRSPPWLIYLLDDIELYERIEHSIDRGSCHPWYALLDIDVYFVGGGVGVSVKQGLQNSAPLDCQ